MKVLLRVDFLKIFVLTSCSFTGVVDLAKMWMRWEEKCHDDLFFALLKSSIVSQDVTSKELIKQVNILHAPSLLTDLLTCKSLLRRQWTLNGKAMQEVWFMPCKIMDMISERYVYFIHETCQILKLLISYGIFNCHIMCNSSGLLGCHIRSTSGLLECRISSVYLWLRIQTIGTNFMIIIL
jgi:hypothetical protein